MNKWLMGLGLGLGVRIWWNHFVRTWCDYLYQKLFPLVSLFHSFSLANEKEWKGWEGKGNEMKRNEAKRQKIKSQIQNVKDKGDGWMYGSIYLSLCLCVCVCVCNCKKEK